MRALAARNALGRPDAAGIAAAVAALRAGELVIVPTDTVYGLAADGVNAGAVARLFAAKGRPLDKAIALLAGSVKQAAAVADLSSSTARDLIARWWPGPLTIVATARMPLPAGVGARGTVGVRLPNDAVLCSVAQGLGRPMAVTSANRSGEDAAVTFEEAVAALESWVTVALDAGPCPIGLPSTVVDVTGPALRVLRQGSAVV